MIISHKHKFIFLKTRKTAGSSIQVALSTICDNTKDIITGSNIKDGVLDESYSAGWNMDKFFTNHPHPPIADVRSFVPEDSWNSYFKFAFVRNPFDIIVSRYHWDVKGKGSQSTSVTGFREWLPSYCNPNGTYWQDEQWRYITLGDGIAVDYVGQYESLNDEYEKIVTDHLGITDVPTLGFQKSGYRDKTHYSEYYDDASIELVYRYFAKDLALFNYTFEYNKDFQCMDGKILIDATVGNDATICPGNGAYRNINGPSLIKVPDSIKNKLGKYYLYFAHHQGKHIRMAYSDNVTGPYKLLQGGTLQLNETPCNGHIASPDIHIVDDKIVMYYHGDISNGQYTFKAESSDGIKFTSDDKVLTPFYHREFNYLGDVYAICKNKNINSQIYKRVGTEYKLQFELLDNSRHTAVYVDGNKLYIFYTIVGEAPERIYVLKIVDWEILSNYELKRPQLQFEGAMEPNVPSRFGMVWGLHNQLRDPCIFNDHEDIYLLYCYGGESGIAISKLLLK